MIPKVKSFAKINLGLKVLNKRPDDFHNIKSLFIRISLNDILEFNPSNEFDLKCTNKAVPINKENTIYKAYNLLSKNFPFKNQYAITLHKNIPLESGMGGGSSNAAFTLIALNNFNNLNLDKEQLIDLGLEIGSDIPFFLSENKSSYVSGRGELLKEYDAPYLESIYILLVIPSFSVSTSWAYKKIKNNLDYKIDSPKFPALDEDVDWKLFCNDFEKIVGSAYPEIFEIKGCMENNGALYSSLSGTGSTMFGIYNNVEFINKTCNKLKNYNTLIVSPT